MTEEQLEQLKKMEQLDIMRKYWPWMESGKITPQQYQFLIKCGRVEAYGEQEPRVPN